jgi:hypothetical protein
MDNAIEPAAESYMPSDLDELIRIFRELGADDPEGWAQSLVKDGNLQLHRFLSFRQAWKLVCDENDDSWIEGTLANRQFDAMAIGRIIERLLALGVDRAEIVDLVREKHYEALFGLCYLLGPRLDNEDEEHVTTMGSAPVPRQASPS